MAKRNIYYSHLQQALEVILQTDESTLAQYTQHTATRLYQNRTTEVQAVQMIA